MIFLQLVYYNLWDIVVKGLHVPKSNVHGRTIVKPFEDWNENYKKLCSIGAKAMDILNCGLNANQFNKIPMCKNVKEIWNTLKVTKRY